MVTVFALRLLFRSSAFVDCCLSFMHKAKSQTHCFEKLSGR